MKLKEFLETYRPESGGLGETWEEHSDRLWRDQPIYMLSLLFHMKKLGRWFGQPAVVDDGVAQDGHHRLVIALELQWYDVDIPWEQAT